MLPVLLQLISISRILGKLRDLEFLIEVTAATQTIGGRGARPLLARHEPGQAGVGQVEVTVVVSVLGPAIVLVTPGTGPTVSIIVQHLNMWIIMWTSCTLLLIILP